MVDAVAATDPLTVIMAEEDHRAGLVVEEEGDGIGMDHIRGLHRGRGTEAVPEDEVDAADRHQARVTRAVTRMTRAPNRRRTDIR